MPLADQKIFPRTGWLEKILVLAVMSGLAVLMTWPLVLRLNEAINDWGDPLLNAWILWWDTHALSTPGLSLFDAPIFFPHANTLAYSEHLIVSSLTVWPVFLLGGGALTAHNLLFLFSFAVAGLGAYLLAFQLTGSRAAALVAGVGFAFSPFRFGHLGHLQILTSHFMPFVLLYLHRWAKQPRWAWAAGFGIFWVLQSLSCGYYALFISLAVGVFLVFYALWFGWWRQRRRYIQLGAVALGMIILVGPFFYPYIKVKKDMGFVRSSQIAASFSAEPKHYLAAPPANRLYGRGSKPFRATEGELFLGFTLSILALAGLAPRRKEQEQDTPQPGGAASRVLLWATGGLALAGAMVWLSGGWQGKLGTLHLSLTSSSRLFMLAGLSLILWRISVLGGFKQAWRQGPGAILGLRAPGDGQRTWPGPDQIFYLILVLVAFWASLGPRYGLYWLLYHLVPGFDSIRVPSRMAVLVSLAWPVLASYGAARLFASRSYKQLLGAGAICLIILAESCSVPLPWQYIYHRPPLVYRWLERQPQPMVIMEIPTLDYRGDFARDARYLYWAAHHKKTLVNGYSGFFPAEYLAMAKQAKRLPKGPGIETLAKLGAQYLVVHTKEFPPAERKMRLQGLKQDPRLKQVYRDSWDYVFKILGPKAHPSDADSPKPAGGGQKGN